ncbi:MAG: FadR/GntR family transcriptional regulator [Pseudomonadota bacterium]
MAEKRLYQKVAIKILELITAGAYPPGTRLPGERELADRFDVSRVVIREAEISLEALGHVEIKVGSGVYVREPEASFSNQLPKVSAFELTQARLLFESESAALAARMITDEQISELERTIERMANASHDSPDGDEADREFHMLIARATGNSVNMHIMQNLWRMRTELTDVRKVYSAVCVEDSSHRVDEHAAILNALRDRNPEEARNAMRYHFSRLIEALLVASEQQAIEEARRRSSVNREKYLKTAMTG